MCFHAVLGCLWHRLKCGPVGLDTILMCISGSVFSIQPIQPQMQDLFQQCLRTTVSSDPKDLAFRLVGRMQKMHMDTIYSAAMHTQTGWSSCHLAAVCLVSWPFSTFTPSCCLCAGALYLVCFGLVFCESITLAIAHVHNELGVLTAQAAAHAQLPSMRKFWPWSW